MTCPKCKVTMREQKRVFHKNRKWICPSCGRIRFQRPKKERRES